MSEPGEPKPPLQPALRDFVGEKSRALTEHPEMEDLLAYAERRLEGERAERLKDHLALCPECTKLFLDLKAFSDDVDTRNEPGTRAETAWRKLEWRIQGEEKNARTAPRGSWQRFAMPLAAGILFVAVGLGILNHQRGPSLIALQVNPPVTDETEFLTGDPVEPEALGAHRGVEGPRDEGKPFPASEDHFLGLTLPSEVIRHDSYRGKVVSSDGRVWPLANLELKSGLEEESGEGFTLTLHRGDLPVGQYTIWVYGVDKGRAEPIISYSFRITE